MVRDIEIFNVSTDVISNHILLFKVARLLFIS